MKRLVSLAIVCAIVGPTWADISPGLYGVEDYAEQGIYKIDESTGAAAYISSLPVRRSGAGASFLNGELYCTNNDVVGEGYVGYGQVDIPTGGLTLVHHQADSHRWFGLASSDNLGLTWTINRDDYTLTSTDLNGVITRIGSTSGIDGQGMAYDDTHGILYATKSSGQLYTIDINTGVPSLVGEMGITAGIGGMAYAEDTQTLYFNAIDGLYTVDVNTGQATFVGSNGGPVIAGLAWIPEPSSLLLLAVGGLLLRCRR